MGDGLCAGFGFLPVPTVVADVVGCGRIAQFPGEVLCQDLGLSHIREVLRLIGRIIVVYFGRNVAVLLLNLGIELLGAVPDGHQFLLFQRRGAFFRFFHKALESGVVVSVLFDNTTGKAGHGGITASFGNDLGAAVETTGHIRIKILCGQILAQGHLTGENLYLRLCRSEEEPGGI